MATPKKTTKVSQATQQSAQPAPAPTPAATPPDPNAALEQFVQQTVAYLDTVEVGLGDDPSLTPAQKRHALKFRKGGENIIAQIGNLAQQQQLESPALNVSDMLAALGRAQDLQPLSNRLSAFVKHVDDVIFTAQSTALSMAQQFYALLQRRSKTDAEVATALAPVVTFFARKPKAKAPGALTKPQTKATKKALATVKKNAPQLLQGAAPAAQGQDGAAAPGAQGGQDAATPAVMTPATAGTGSTAAGSANGHS